MNNKLAILIKNYFQVLWGGFKYHKRSGKIFGSSLLIVVGAAVLAGVMGMTAYGQVLAYSGSGQPQLAFFYFLLLSLMMAVFASVLRGSASNDASDADMLLAMPLRRETILLAKSLSKYGFELLPISVFFLPVVIVYQLLIQPGLATLLRALLVWLMIPLLSVGVAYLLGWMFFKISGRLKNPSIITTVLSLLILLGFIGISSFGGAAESGGAVAAYYYSLRPLAWAVDFIVLGSWQGFLGFALITAGPFALGLILNSRIFGVSQKSWRSKKTGLDLHQRSPLQALVKKELNRFFSSSAYLLNAGMGMIMSAILTIVIIIGRNSFLAPLLAMEGAAAILPAALAITYSCCAGMCYLSACSISLEGRQLWILKTLPLAVRDIFAAKIKANLLITLPLTVLGAAISSLTLGFELLTAIALILVCAAFCLLTATAGLVINLLFPKLDWTEEIKVIKQSMSVMLAFFLGTIPVAIIFGLYIVMLQGMISFALLSLLAAIAFTAAAFACAKWLGKRGESIFAALQ